MHAEGQQSNSDREALAKAVEDGRLATLQSLSSPFPADAQDAFYAYAQSQSVAEYMINTFGKDKLNHLLVLLNDGNTMDDALLTTYGFNLNGLDEAWIKYMTEQPENNPETGKLLRKESSKDAWPDRLMLRALAPALAAGAA